MKENRILQIWRILYPPLMYFVISYMIQLVGILLLTQNYIASVWESGNLEELQLYFTETYNQNAMLLVMIASIVTIPICVILFRGDCKRRENRNYFLEQKQIPVQKWILIAVLGMAASISLNDWIALSGIILIFDGFEQVAEAIYGGSLLIEFLAIAVAAPLVEELIFRGLVYQRMRELSSAKIAIILSALYFGIYHMNVVQGLYAFLLGILLAWVYEKYQTLWAPILFHASANLLSVICTEWNFSYRMTVIGVILEIVISTGLMIYAIVRIHRTV